MCGIVGVVNPTTIADEKVFSQLLTVDVLRGDHSTGVFNLFKNGKESTYLKEAVAGGSFIKNNQKTLQDKIFVRDALALVGHNRYATQGEINDANAHPFAHGSIALVHNGTLLDESYLPKTFQTDSEGIAYALSVSNNPKDILEQLDGAFTLVWADLSKGTLNFARNSQRPLYIAEHKSRNTLYFASEELMLSWILKRNNIETNKIRSLEVGSWVAIDFSRGNKYSMRTTKFTPVPEYSGWYKKYSGFWGGGGSSSNKKDSEITANMFKKNHHLYSNTSDALGFHPLASTYNASENTMDFVGHLEEDTHWGMEPVHVRLPRSDIDAIIKELNRIAPGRAKNITEEVLMNSVLFVEVNPDTHRQTNNGDLSVSVPDTVNFYPRCLSDGAVSVGTQRVLWKWLGSLHLYVDLKSILGDKLDVKSAPLLEDHGVVMVSVTQHRAHAYTKKSSMPHRPDIVASDYNNSMDTLNALKEYFLELELNNEVYNIDDPDNHHYHNTLN